jgi:hypothetical protein
MACARLQLAQLTMARAPTPLEQSRPRMILEQLSVADVTRRVSTDLCRLTSIILKIDAPLPAADVRKPARKEWPENRRGDAVDGFEYTAGPLAASIIETDRAFLAWPSH